MPQEKEKFTFSKSGAMWELRINGRATGILVDDKERAVALSRRREGKLVAYFMQTFDSKRWSRFRAALEQVAE